MRIACHKIYIVRILVILSFSILFSCTDLNAPLYDKSSEFWRTEEEISAGVAPAYSGLRNIVFPFGIYSLNELSTDEIIVPRRGLNWNDNGVWEQMWKHTWGPNHFLIDIAWSNIYGGIAEIDLIIKSVNQTNLNEEDKQSIEAELKTVRALYYFIALDLFGNIPINNGDISEQKSRVEVFEFVEKELLDNLDYLTTEVNPKSYGSATKWFAYALLAKLYLNSEVYTGEAQLTKCIAACDAILGSNIFALEEDYFFNFLIKNEASRENTFSIPFDREEGLNGFFIHLLSLHPNSNETFGLSWGGFNGFCTTKEYYDQFNASDIRRESFLVGQQYKNQVESPVNLQYDDLGNLLIFDPEITEFSIQAPKTETAGARIAKWEFNKEGDDMSNDFAYFRLADIIMMKAEAQYRTGDAAGALITINQKINGVSIRSRSGLPDFSAAEMNLDGLLAERAREFTWEGHRRNDMIRFGRFTDARIPEKDISEQYRLLYPIPRSVMENNPNFIQNPGY